MIKREALLIIDVQNDFCPGGSLAVPGGDLIISRINAVSGKFEKVVATKDWHPPGHISFASSHKDRSPGDTVSINGRKQYLWPDHCVQKSDGARLNPGLDMGPVNLILHKGGTRTLDSYSAFFENDRETATGLAGYLKGMSVRTLYICGLATDYCVYFSAKDALGLGFKVILLGDCSAGVDLPEGNLKKTLAAMKKAGIETASSGDL